MNFQRIRNTLKLNNNLKSYCFIFILFCFTKIFAQDSKNNLRPLKQVLTTVEQEFDVKFAYSNELIEFKMLDVSISNKSLAQVILEIKRKIKLEIREISDKRYAVVLPPKTIDICGELYLNSNEEEKLYGATVKILNSDRGSISNLEGTFSLKKVPVNTFLEISYIGFETVLISVRDFLFQDCLSIPVKEEIALLREIVITNYLTNSISKTKDGAIVFRPRNQNVLPGLTEPDILQSAQQLPGVLSTDETASGLHIRGGTPDQNLILFDGVKLFNTGHFFGTISALNPYIIDKATVYRNVSNSKYGNHIAGIVDVETSSEIPKKVAVSAGFNFTHVDGNIKVPLSSKMSALFSVRRSISDIVETPTFNKLANKAFQHTAVSNDLVEGKDYSVRTKNIFKFIDYNTKVNYKISDKDLVTFSQIAIKNKFDYNFLNLDLEEERNDNLSLENYGYNVSWDKKITHKFTQSVDVSYSKYELLYDNYKNSTNTKYASIKKKNKVDNFDFKLDHTYRFKDHQSIKYGYQYAFQNIAYSLNRENLPVFLGNKVTDGSNRNTTHTLFGEYLYSQKDKYTISIGLRGNYFSLLNLYTIEPRIFLQMKVIPKLWLNASFEKKQQNTSKILEFDTIDFGLENQLWALSDGDQIPLLESDQVTFGVQYQKNNWIVDVDLYKRNIDGLTTLTTGFESFIQEIYVGKATTLGLDVLIKKNWKNYHTWLSYTTGTSKFRFDNFNDDKEFNGNFDVSHSFYWSNNFTFKKITLSTGFTYRVGIPFSSTSGQNPNFGIVRNGINDSRLPNYHRFDVSATYDFNLGKNIKAKIGLSLLNVFDRQNILRREYENKRTTDNRIVLTKNDTKSQGFTPNFFFRISF